MVVIKDFGMPSCCGKCKFGQRFNPDEDICRIDGHIIKSTFATITQNRDEKCPLIGIEERKPGKWIKEEDTLGWDGHSYQCSVCGRSIHLDTEVEDLEDYPYCHCGAEMRGTENE